MNSVLVFLDIETTGLNPMVDSIIEIACLKVQNINQLEFKEDNTYHKYVNTTTDITQESFEVHGISKEFLKDKQFFHQISGEVLSFIGDHPVVAHNASFDISFLKAELQRVGSVDFNNEVIDSLMIAKKMYPGSQVSLDALMRRFGMSTRGLHSALEDAKILARIYSCMHMPKQGNLFMETQSIIKTKYQICQKIIKDCP